MKWFDWCTSLQEKVVCNFVMIWIKHGLMPFVVETISANIASDAYSTQFSDDAKEIVQNVLKLCEWEKENGTKIP